MSGNLVCLLKGFHVDISDRSLAQHVGLDLIPNTTEIKTKVTCLI